MQHQGLIEWIDTTDVSGFPLGKIFYQSIRTYTNQVKGRNTDQEGSQSHSIYHS